MIRSNRSKRLKKTKTTKRKSNNNNSPPVPTLSLYFSPPLTLTKTPTLPSILIKKIQHSSNSIRLKLNKKKDQSQYHQ